MRLNRSDFARRSARAHRSPASLLEALEARQMLAVDTIFTDLDGDQWRIQVTGANATAVITPGTAGLRSLVISGTTASSDVTISENFVSRGPAPGNGRLAINLIQINGDVDAVSLLDGVDLIPENGQGGFHGLQISGRARLIESSGDILASDIEIQSTAANNRTSLELSFAFGDAVPLRGLVDLVNITSGGFIESLRSPALNNASISASRIGTIDVAAASFNRGGSFTPMLLNVSTSDATATYGLKSARINGSLFAGEWNIASNVQKIIATDIPDQLDLARGQTIGQFLLTVDGRVDELRTTSGDISGRFLARSFGIIRANDDIRGAEFGLFVARGVQIFQLATIDSLRSGDQMVGVDVLATGKVKQIVCGSSMFATNFDILSVDQFQVGSDMDSSVLTANTDSGYGIKLADVKGQMTNSALDAESGNIGKVTLGSMVDSRVSTGLLAPSNTLLSAANQFQAFRTIDSIRIKPVSGGPNAFVNSFIMSGTITEIISTVTPTTNNGGTAFGVAAVTYGVAQFRVNAGLTLGGGGASVNLQLRDL